MNEKAKRDISRKLRILEHEKNTGNVTKICRYFGISRDSFYTWRKAFDKSGKKGLINDKPCPENPNIRVDKVIVYLDGNQPTVHEKANKYFLKYIT